MAFDWMVSGDGRGEREAGRLREMFLAEAARRTELYLNLRFSRADAIARIRGNLRWEFEMNGVPAFLGDVDAVVNAIYDREEGQSAGSGVGEAKGARGRRGR